MSHIPVETIFRSAIASIPSGVNALPPTELINQFLAAGLWEFTIKFAVNCNFNFAANPEMAAPVAMIFDGTLYEPMPSNPGGTQANGFIVTYRFKFGRDKSTSIVLRTAVPLLSTNGGILSISLLCEGNTGR